MTSLVQANHFRSVVVLSLIFGLGAAGLTGCDAVDNSGSGTVGVLLTDAPFPFDMVDSANVTIDRVELVSAEEGIINVTEAWTEPQEFNLLDLRDGVTALLGEVEVSEGIYEQIRLIIAEEASVVMNEESGGTHYDLTVPSGTETGIKISLDSLEVESGSFVTLTLDFDVAESFVVLGDIDTPAGVLGFNFTPVVKLASVELTAVPEEAAG